MDIQEYIAPELFILIPVLYIIGMMLKKFEGFSDRYIPIVLGIIGIIISMTYEFSILGFSWAAVYSSLIQGVLCAGCAVYGNQIVKQTGKSK